MVVVDLCWGMAMTATSAVAGVAAVRVIS
jgi:uncharacterized membrane protein